MNAASYAQPIAPGSIVSIFGSNLATKTATAVQTPLPTQLGETSVTVNGIQAPLFFVSPGQINLQVPSSIPFSYSGFTTAVVAVTNATGSSAPVEVPLNQTSPALWTTDASGCGQAVALNIAPNGTYSVNTPLNSAAPGDYIALFGNGFGTAYAQPPDGTSPLSAAQMPNSGAGIVDGKQLTLLQYFGLAPDFVGVDQINFQIPAATRDGCAVPVAIEGVSLISPTVTISIHSTRGRCVDPPTHSYGDISITRTITTGTDHDSETDTLAAAFLSGAGLKRPQLTQVQLEPGSYLANNYAAQATSRSCAAGYSEFPAGSLQIQGPAGSVVVSPASGQNGAVTYSQSLPAGFVTPGAYTITAAGNATTGAFGGHFQVGSPIQIQTDLSPRSAIPFDQPFTVKWSGGDPGTQVTVKLVYTTSLGDYYSYSYTDTANGSLTFDPICSGHSIASGGNGVFCSFGSPGINEVIVEQSTGLNNQSALSAPEITDGIQVSWTYRFIFGAVGQF